MIVDRMIIIDKHNPAFCVYLGREEETPLSLSDIHYKFCNDRFVQILIWC